MNRTSKGFAIFIILIIAISNLSLIMVKPASAQSIIKPSIPEFIVKFVNSSYSVTTINPYTGANETQQIINNSIKITINNQLFDNSNNQLYYNVRAKPHFAENWTEIYPIQNRTISYNGDGTFSFGWYIDDSSPKSNSSYTTITFPIIATEYYGESGYDIQRYYSGDIDQEGRYFAFLHGIPAIAQIDFQVEALVGQNSTYWYIQHPLFPQYGGFNEPGIAYKADSGWSITQTIAIGEISASPTPAPTVPEFPSVTIPLLLTIMVVVDLLVYQKKQTQRETNKLEIK